MHLPSPRPPQRSVKVGIPDLLTTANLACGVASILLASQGQLTIACGLIFLAALFDVLDGLAARALGGGSEFGKQLDSLADMVSFGVAPGIFVNILVYRGVMTDTMLNGMDVSIADDEHAKWIALAATLIIPLASAWRLAKFNLDPRQINGFLGLPTPANALFWASVLYLSQDASVSLARYSALIVVAASLILSSLMLSELPLPSLKLKSTKWKGNEVIYLLLAASLLLIILYGVLAVPLILIIYLLSPLWGKLFHRNA